MARKMADCRRFPSDSNCWLTIIGEEEEATPDNESAHLKLTVTGVLFHPEEFAAGVWIAVIAGRELVRRDADRFAVGCVRDAQPVG